MISSDRVDHTHTLTHTPSGTLSLSLSLSPSLSFSLSLSLAHVDSYTNDSLCPSLSFSALSLFLSPPLSLSLVGVSGAHELWVRGRCAKQRGGRLRGESEEGIK